MYGRAFSLQMDFPAFVRAVAAVPDERAEKHFRSQTSFLYRDGRRLVDFVGRLEDFEERLGGGLPAHPPAARHGPTTSPGPRCRLEDWYDADLLGLVNARYAADFTLLGYPVRDRL